MTDAPLDRDIEELEWLAYWLDERFRIPGTNFRIGFDAGFKANRRNVNLVTRHLRKQHAKQPVAAERVAVS